MFQSSFSSSRILGGGDSNLLVWENRILTTLLIAEDVLGDLGARQAIRNMPKNVRL